MRSKSRIIAATYGGNCRNSACRAPIEKGQSIEVTSGVPGGLCMKCVNPEKHGGLPRERPEKRQTRGYSELFGEDDA